MKIISPRIKKLLLQRSKRTKQKSFARRLFPMPRRKHDFKQFSRKLRFKFKNSGCVTVRTRGSKRLNKHKAKNKKKKLIKKNKNAAITKKPSKEKKRKKRTANFSLLRFAKIQKNPLLKKLFSKKLATAESRAIGFLYLKKRKATSPVSTLKKIKFLLAAKKLKQLVSQTYRKKAKFTLRSSLRLRSRFNFYFLTHVSNVLNQTLSLRQLLYRSNKKIISTLVRAYARYANFLSLTSKRRALRHIYKNRVDLKKLGYVLSSVSRKNKKRSYAATKIKKTSRNLFRKLKFFQLKRFTKRSTNLKKLKKNQKLLRRFAITKRIRRNLRILPRKFILLTKNLRRKYSQARKPKVQTAQSVLARQRPGFFEARRSTRKTVAVVRSTLQAKHSVFSTVKKVLLNFTARSRRQAFRKVRQKKLLRASLRSASPRFQFVTQFLKSYSSINKYERDRRRGQYLSKRTRRRLLKSQYLPQ